MRTLFALVALLYSTAVMAQSNPPPASSPPTVGGQPLVQVKPHSAKAAPAPKESGPPKSIAKRLQACLEIDDGTKGRLDCYDAAMPPQPKAKPGTAKGVLDCRFIKEEDDRLTCINGFAESIPKFSQ